MRPAHVAFIGSLLVLAAAPTARGADGGAAPGGPSARPGAGGAAHTPARRRRPHKRRSTPPRVSALRVPSVAYGPDAGLRVRLKLAGRGTRSMRLVLFSAAGTTVGQLELGRVRTGRTVSVRWRLHGLLEGAYRLEARGAGRAARRALAVRWSRFPVAGEHTFGSDDARFGAPRRGHTHQGQDILAGAETPVVAPRAATVLRRAYQKGGAGLYLVLHGDDGRDYVFMHLLADSVLVEPGARIATGQRIAAVGATGEATGAHLHFEIWVGGWAAPGGAPIDPLPELLAWDAWS